MTALLGLATRLKLARLMLITGARVATSDLAEFAGAAFAGGVDIIQLREPRDSSAVLVTGLETIARVAGRDGLVGAYGPIDVAERTKADLLQLSAMDGSGAQAREQLGEWTLIGRSCHSPAQVDAAVADPQLAFFTVSPVFNTGGVGEAGLALVRHAAAAAPPSAPKAKPWFAVGGINLDNLDQVLAAGARRIGVTRAIATAPDARVAAVEVEERLRAAWEADPGMEQATFTAFG